MRPVQVGPPDAARAVVVLHVGPVQLPADQTTRVNARLSRQANTSVEEQLVERGTSDNLSKKRTPPPTQRDPDHGTASH